MNSKCGCNKTQLVNKFTSINTHTHLRLRNVPSWPGVSRASRPSVTMRCRANVGYKVHHWYHQLLSQVDTITVSPNMLFEGAICDRFWVPWIFCWPCLSVRDINVTLRKLCRLKQVTVTMPCSCECYMTLNPVCIPVKFTAAHSELLKRTVYAVLQDTTEVVMTDIWLGGMVECICAAGWNIWSILDVHQVLRPLVVKTHWGLESH